MQRGKENKKIDFKNVGKFILFVLAPLTIIGAIMLVLYNLISGNTNDDDMKAYAKSINWNIVEISKNEATQKAEELFSQLKNYNSAGLNHGMYNTLLKQGYKDAPQTDAHLYRYNEETYRAINAMFGLKTTWWQNPNDWVPTFASKSNLGEVITYVMAKNKEEIDYLRWITGTGFGL
jgi:hypothetical protein